MPGELGYSGGCGAGTGQPKGEKERDMRCGKGHEHATTAEVRACYGVGGVTTIPSTGDAFRQLNQRAGSQRQPRANKYPGDCFLCGATVEPMAGILSRSEGVGSQRLGEGTWQVRHQDHAACTEAQEMAAIKKMEPFRVIASQKAQAGRADFSSIPQGYYATRKENGIDFWFVRVPEDGTWKGFRLAKRIVGGNGGPERIRKSEQIAALHAIIKAGVDAAGNLFADEMEQCKYCRKPLTRHASRDMRCGSTCAGNHGVGDEWDRLDLMYGHQ